MPKRPGFPVLAVGIVLALEVATLLFFRSWHIQTLSQDAERVSAQLHPRVKNVFDSTFYFFFEDQFKPQLQSLLKDHPHVEGVGFFSKKGDLIYSTDVDRGDLLKKSRPPSDLGRKQEALLRVRGFSVECWVPSESLNTVYLLRSPGVVVLVAWLWGVVALATLLLGWLKPQVYFWNFWREAGRQWKWRWGRWWGLRPQVLATIVLVNAVTGTIIAGSLSQQQTRDYSEKLQKESLLFSVFTAEKIANDFTNLFYFFYQERFLPSLKQVMSSNENLRRIRLVSVKHRSVLFDSEQLMDAAMPIPTSDVPLVDWESEKFEQLKNSGQWTSDSSVQKKVIQTVRNENQEPWFYVEFTFGNETLLRSVAALRRQILWDLIPSMVIGFLISVIFSQLLISPIQKLVRAMKQVASGDYDVALALSRRDELGDLLLAFNRMTAELRKKKELRKYLSDSTYRQVMAAPEHPGGLRLKGTRVRATVLFSDIRDFVRHCESLDAEEVTTLLTDYFTEMVESVYSHGGEVDKFIGDALLAVFYEPDSTDTGNTSLHAIQAALDMKSRLEAFNQKRRDHGKRPIEIGIGISHGEIISGPIGSKDRMDFTVIGDVVNVANRIEKLSKNGRHSRIVFSGPVEQRVTGLIQYEPLEGASIRGKAEDVRVFELIRILDIHELTEQIQSGDVEHRIRSIQILGQSKNQEALEWMIKLLKDPEVRIRDEAAKAIQKLGEPSGAGDAREGPGTIHDRLQDVLFSRLELEKSEKVLATLISTIGKLSNSEEMNRLIPYLDSPNDRVVANAVEALGRLPSAKIADLILPKLASVHNRVKANAAMALFSTGHYGVIDTLKPMLMHSNPLMRSSAAFAIGEMTKLSKRDALMDEWKKLTPEVKQFLAELQETVPMLVSLLKDPDLSVKRQAIIALGKIKDRSAVLPILDHIDLGTDSKEILNDIAQALREIGSHKLVRDVVERLL